MGHKVKACDECDDFIFIDDCRGIVRRIEIDGTALSNFYNLFVLPRVQIEHKNIVKLIGTTVAAHDENLAFVDRTSHWRESWCEVAGDARCGD